MKKEKEINSNESQTLKIRKFWNESVTFSFDAENDTFFLVWKQTL